jgi:hypothetical protein
MRASPRIVLYAAIAAACAVTAAGALGVATAEAPTVAPVRAVSVQGVATEAIDQSASAAAATAVYRQGMSDAVADALAKAQFLAGKAGAALGAAQTVVEDGGEISCVGENEYRGEQPDFGYPRASVSIAPVTRAAAPALGRSRALRRRGRHGAPIAKKATVPTCTLSARVSVTYAMG